MADAVLVIGANTKEVQEQLRKAGLSIDEVGSKTKKQSGLLSSFKKNWVAVTAAAAGFAVAAKKVADVLITTTKKAIDFEEANSKFGVVFQNNSREANAMRKELVKAYGLSSLAATEMLSGIQDFLVPMGLARKEATGLSGKIAILARDLGSFNNQPTAEVMQAIQSALSGIAMPMKRFGVDVSQAGLKQQMLNEGLKGSVKDLSRAEKAQLIYRKIVADSSDAIGDYRRTMDQAANSLVSIKATAEDVQLAIGQQLLKEIQPTLAELQKFAKSEEFFDGIKKSIHAIRIGFNLIAISSRMTRTIMFDAWFIPVKNAFLGLGRIIKAFIDKDFKGAYIAIKNTGKDIVKDYRELGKDFKTDVLDITNAVTQMTKTSEEEFIKGMDNIVNKRIETKDVIIEETRNMFGTLTELSTDWEKSLEKDLDNTKGKFANTYRAITTVSETFVNSVVDSFENMKTSSKGILKAIAQGFIDLFAGELAVMAANELKKAIAMTIVLNPAAALHYAASAALIAGSIATKAAGSAIINKIDSAATGADFVTNGPQLLMVGDNPSGREHVQVTPSERGGGASIVINNLNVSEENIAQKVILQFRKMGIKVGR